MTRAPNLCIVSLDVCTQLLMPATKGLQLVALLQSAQRVHPDYVMRPHMEYQVKGDLEVEYKVVKSSQIRQPDAASRTRKAKTKPADADV